MSAFDAFSRLCGAPWHSQVHGEDVVITRKAGGTISCKATVHRDQIDTRTEDEGRRLEYPITVEIEISNYPDPNIQGDTISVAVRTGDSAKTTKKVAKIITQTGGKWHLGLS